ncbi:unnamed protein product [Amoebophrya sp. A120]|nr:unnamed protein product [Amoebophrya sp. A120]|eukprot:GSA120T00019343001.1
MTRTTSTPHQSISSSPATSTSPMRLRATVRFSQRKVPSHPPPAHRAVVTNMLLGLLACDGPLPAIAVWDRLFGKGAWDRDLGQVFSSTTSGSEEKNTGAATPSLSPRSAAAPAPTEEVHPVAPPQHKYRLRGSKARFASGSGSSGVAVGENQVGSTTTTSNMEKDSQPPPSSALQKDENNASADLSDAEPLSPGTTSLDEQQQQEETTAGATGPRDAHPSGTTSASSFMIAQEKKQDLHDPLVSGSVGEESMVNSANKEEAVKTETAAETSSNKDAAEKSSSTVVLKEKTNTATAAQPEHQESVATSTSPSSASSSFVAKKGGEGDEVEEKNMNKKLPGVTEMEKGTSGTSSSFAQINRHQVLHHGQRAPPAGLPAGPLPQLPVSKRALAKQAATSAARTTMEALRGAKNFAKATRKGVVNSSAWKGAKEVGSELIDDLKKGEIQQGIAKVGRKGLHAAEKQQIAKLKREREWLEKRVDILRKHVIGVDGKDKETTEKGEKTTLFRVRKCLFASVDSFNLNGVGVDWSFNFGSLGFGIPIEHYYVTFELPDQQQHEPKEIVVEYGGGIEGTETGVNVYEEGDYPKEMVDPTTKQVLKELGFDEARSGRMKSKVCLQVLETALKAATKWSIADKKLRSAGPRLGMVMEDGGKELVKAQRQVTDAKTLIQKLNLKKPEGQEPSDNFVLQLRGFKDVHDVTKFADDVARGKGFTREGYSAFQPYGYNCQTFANDITNVVRTQEKKVNFRAHSRRLTGQSPGGLGAKTFSNLDNAEAYISEKLLPDIREKLVTEQKLLHRLVCSLKKLAAKDRHNDEDRKKETASDIAQYTAQFEQNRSKLKQYLDLLPEEEKQGSGKDNTPKARKRTRMTNFLLGRTLGSGLDEKTREQISTGAGAATIVCNEEEGGGQQKDEK